MNTIDFNSFVETWRGAHEVFGSKQSDAAVAISFKVLSEYPLEEIKHGLAAHLADPDLGRFAPKPADVIAQIAKSVADDGRPEANEAWSIAIKSFDEAETVVMNDEIAGALSVARDIYLEGDKVGARMAFKENYERSVLHSRKKRDPVKWFPSLGHDPARREAALRDAQDIGRLQKPQVDSLLPDSRVNADVLMLIKDASNG